MARPFVQAAIAKTRLVDVFLVEQSKSLKQINNVVGATERTDE
jgi:hypothetical protein